MVKEKTKIKFESNLNRVSLLNLSVTRAAPQKLLISFLFRCPWRPYIQNPETMERNKRNETKSTKTVIREVRANVP